MYPFVALCHIIDVIASHLSITGIKRLAPLLRVLDAVRAVNNVPEKTRQTFTH